MFDSHDILLAVSLSVAAWLCCIVVRMTWGMVGLKLGRCDIGKLTPVTLCVLMAVMTLATFKGGAKLRSPSPGHGAEGNGEAAPCLSIQDSDGNTDDDDRAASEVRDFVYDGWNLVNEFVAAVDGATTNITEIQYFWGLDLSVTLQGAGGVGGLLAVSRDGSFHFPVYDNNGNVMKYVDESGAVVAAYVYDDFGNTISRAGSLADFFRHCFSTKYFDAETGLYYYGYRFYSPVLLCWLTRDTIEERGGVNLYCMCRNSSVFSFDVLGMDRYMTTFSLNPKNDQWHVGVAVDTWKCSNGNWVKTGVATFDFRIDYSSFWNRLGTYFATLGTIMENEGNTLVNPHVIPSSPEQDIEMLKRIRTQLSDPPIYSFFFNNCIHWATTVIDYGMDK